MELALYAPRLGYYSGGSEKLGKDGDFTTAPEMTPLFGCTLAHVVAGLMAQCSPQIMEFGAGSGKLAFDILTELSASGITVERYAIVDLSGELRARQQLLLRDFPQVVWLTAMPESFSGVILGNEVLDAMPVNLVTRTEQGWEEVGVALLPESSPDDLPFHLQPQPCSDTLLEQIATQIPDAALLAPGYLTEIHPVSTGFMHSMSAMMTAGKRLYGTGSAAILIDYGFPAHEYYLAQRAQGTLMCHYRHHAHPDPLIFPGLQDITAHVDFTAMATAAVHGGLEVLGYMCQAAFLMCGGISDLLLRTDPGNALQYLPQANAVHKLLSPAEMGELFKVLVIGTGVSLPDNFAGFDRSYRL